MFLLYILTIVSALTMHASILCEETTDQYQKMLSLQTEITELSQLQAELKDQKETIQAELQKAATQLEETRQRQIQLDNDIKRYGYTIKELSSDNAQLSQDNEKLADVAKALKADKEALEEKIAQLESTLEEVQTKAKIMSRKKIEAKTKSAIEIHRLQRTINHLQEKVDDCSWSDAIDKHVFKMIVCCAAGAVTMWSVDHYVLRTA